MASVARIYSQLVLGVWTRPLNAQPLATWSSAQSVAKRPSRREAADRLKSERVIIEFSMQGHVLAKIRFRRLPPCGLFANRGLACGVRRRSLSFYHGAARFVGWGSLCGFLHVDETGSLRGFLRARTLDAWIEAISHSLKRFPIPPSGWRSFSECRSFSGWRSVLGRRRHWKPFPGKAAVREISWSVSRFLCLLVLRSSFYSSPERRMRAGFI